jgi:triosephosphate isomerase
MTRRKLVAGNWKMHGGLAQLAELDGIAAAARANPSVDVAICPPFTLIGAAAIRGDLAIGAQDCHQHPKGAHTGCVSAEMLKEAGATLAIVGHSERRTDQRETSEEVCAKARAAIDAGLTAIVCVGETRAERDAGKALEVVGRQIDGSVPDGATANTLVVAYEPVWAIGTGLTPTPKDVEEVHDFIHQKLTDRLSGEGAAVRILYGGSVKPSNAAELMAVPNVNGALVGGASLKAKDFLGIADVYR